MAPASPSQGTSLKRTCGPSESRSAMYFGARKGAAGGEHANVAGAAGGSRGLQRRLDAHHGQFRVFGAHQMNRGGGGCVARHHKRLDAALADQLVDDGARALDHEVTLTPRSPYGAFCASEK